MHPTRPKLEPLCAPWTGKRVRRTKVNCRQEAGEKEKGQKEKVHRPALQIQSQIPVSLARHCRDEAGLSSSARKFVPHPHRAEQTAAPSAALEPQFLSPSSISEGPTSHIILLLSAFSLYQSVHYTPSHAAAGPPPSTPCSSSQILRIGLSLRSGFLAAAAASFGPCVSASNERHLREFDFIPPISIYHPFLSICSLVTSAVARVVKIYF